MLFLNFSIYKQFNVEFFEYLGISMNILNIYLLRICIYISVCLISIESSIYHGLSKLSVSVNNIYNKKFLCESAKFLFVRILWILMRIASDII